MNRPTGSASAMATLFLAGTLIAAGWSPPPGLAATTIGPDVGVSSSSAAGCSSTTMSATCSNATLTGGALVASPIDGVVVRWRVRVDGGTGTATFRVLREVSPDVFTGAGSSDPSPRFGELGEFPTRLPIQAGDRIGVDLPPFVGPCAEGCVRTVSGGSMDIWRPPLADGASPGVSPGGMADFTALINADVEPDADGDAFGDETQDSCPAVQGTDAGCPPAVDEPARVRPFLADPPRPPRVRLSGPRLQHLLARGGVTVFVTSAEPGSVVAKATINLRGRRKVKIARLNPASSNLAPGAETRLRLKLSKKARNKVRRADRNGRKLKAMVTAAVKGAAATAVVNRTIQIKGSRIKGPKRAKR